MVISYNTYIFTKISKTKLWKLLQIIMYKYMDIIHVIIMHFTLRIHYTLLCPVM